MKELRVENWHCLFTFSDRFSCEDSKVFFVCFSKYFMYSFLKRGEGKEKERERNITCLLYTSDAADDWLVV